MDRSTARFFAECDERRACPTTKAAHRDRATRLLKQPHHPWGECALRRRRPWGADAGTRRPEVRGASLYKGEDHGPGRIHRHVQGRDRPAGGRVVPAPLPALRERTTAPPTAPLPAWGRRPTPSAARPSPSQPTGARPSSGRWAPARPSSPRPPPTWRASGRVLVLCPPHLTRKWKREVEGDGPRRARRHRRIHHRPRTAPPLRRPRPPLRRHVAGTGEALLPLAARRRRAVGRLRRAG